ncbi:protein dehydration-induced 19 homolog 3 [Phtheirospermum japonicum]|uniref:Protein dehydration-induced 19 homolog 3 n=1 Tax=Phtheirospermum japonicum TaxID=374723 RepID=A0A830CRF8_9LAMI|nr:protein dehydration-induced 19 homolog 3 [Phtheirospermum japonicum]
MGDRFYDDLEIALSSFSIQSNDDYYNEEEEETEGEDYEGEEVNDVEIEEKSEEMACPFCPEDFDVLGLCCHIDADHRMEVKPGICPVCATKVGINMASHESPSAGPSSDAAADTMFLSFVNNNNQQSADRTQSVEASSKTNTSLVSKNSIDDYLESHPNSPPLVHTQRPTTFELHIQANSASGRRRSRRLELLDL